MSQKKKYQLFITATVLLFLYLTATEAFDRYEAVLGLFGTLQQKEASVLDPQSLAEKKMHLLAKKRLLGSSLTTRGAQYDQSETGVFEYLNATANAAGVRFQSLTPAESRSGGQIKEVGYKLQLETEFHRVGAFLNAIETGALLSQIKRIELVSSTSTAPRLNVTVEGSAYVLPGKYLR